MYKLLLAIALSTAAAQTLETFDGSRTWSETNDPVMGGLSQATFKISGGTGVFNGTCKIVPSCVEMKFRRPTPSTRCCLHNRVCSIASRFHAIDATMISLLFT